MRRAVRIAGWFAAVTVAGALGCNQNPFMPSQQTAAWQQQAPLQPQESQLYDLNRRAFEMDANNRDLHAQLAQSRQQVNLLREEVAQLQKEAVVARQQLTQMQLAKDDAERKFQALQTSTTQRGGAAITANNSLRNALRPVQMGNLEVRQEGETVRVTLPADQLFALGTAQLAGSAFPILDGVAAEIARNYPRQFISIEGHTDNSPPPGGFSNHQISAAQATMVLEQFTRRNRLPAKQFSVSAQGENRPLDTNDTQVGRTKNRRIELVILPQVFDGP